MKNNPWTRYFQDRETAKARLFCLPHAGGVSEFFLSWKKFLPPEIDICPLQLPNRSYRIDEPMPESLQDTAREICTVIEERSDKPYALFGHSMGSILAYETASRLHNKPSLLILSGGEPPHLWGRSKPIHDLSDDELIALLIEKGSQDLMTIQMMKKESSKFLKTLRNDLKLCSDYRYKENEIIKEKTMIVYTLDDELCDYRSMQMWDNYCSDIIRITYDQGGHFFLKEHADDLIGKIVKALDPFIRTDS